MEMSNGQVRRKHPTSICFSGGQELHFTYVDNKLKTIKDIIGREIVYEYEGIT